MYVRHSTKCANREVPSVREPDANPGERGDSSRMLRVATWNMDHWKRTVQARARAWSLLQQTLDLDVALLQETVPPKKLTREHVVYRPIGGTRGWGSAVVAPAARVPLDE